MTDQQFFRTLSEHLGRVAAAMEDLVYHLEVHVLVLAHGNPSRLGRAAADIERSGAQVAEAEMARTELVRDERPQWAGRTLAETIAEAEEPWHGVLSHQRRALETLHTAAAELSAETTQAARIAARRNREMLQVLSGEGQPLVEGYGRTPSAFGIGRTAPVMVDRTV